MSPEIEVAQLRRENKQLRERIRQLESQLAKANKDSSTSSKRPPAISPNPTPNPHAKVTREPKNVESEHSPGIPQRTK